MPYSECCWAHTTMPEIGICPDCKEQCEFEDFIDPSDDQIFNNHNTEGGINFKIKSHD